MAEEPLKNKTIKGTAWSAADAFLGHSVNFVQDNESMSSYGVMRGLHFQRPPFTHPDIIRFFMLIPEACKLVLEAGTMGKGGEIFVFDMGKPVKIVDLAKRMIQLSGAKNIEIRFTDLTSLHTRLMKAITVGVNGTDNNQIAH